MNDAVAVALKIVARVGRGLGYVTTQGLFRLSGVRREVHH
jgi:hypothetical protein